MSEEYPAIRCQNCRFERTGVHYNIWSISKGGVAGLRNVFPEGKANEMNFVLFSTSGVHGCYTTIEEIEESLIKYGPTPSFMEDGSEEEIPDDYVPNGLTVTVYHPRIIGVGYGVINITLEDVPYLKTLRESSWHVVSQIGRKAINDR
jgi:hypothetical protein